MAHELRHRWSIEHNLLSGITFGRWLSVLHDNNFAVEATYLHRALFLTGVSVFNSVCACVERMRYEKQIRAAAPAQPIFILGHWRSGTTHLHNLLAQDTDSFSYPNTYQVLSPESFLTTESINSRLFAKLIPATRPMDNMTLSFQSPQEDEIGGFRIPKNSRIVISTHTVHRLPAIWEDPDEFRPERFERSVSATRHYYSYIPFGGGPRVCIGQHFAMIEALIIIALVVREYRLEIAPAFQPLIDPGITLRSKNGLWMFRRAE